MRMRMRIRGTGKPADPFRAPIPTYSLVSLDESTGLAIVEIPDDIGPDDFDQPGSQGVPVIGGVPTIIGLRLQQRIAFRQKLARLYDRLSGQFDADAIG